MINENKRKCLSLLSSQLQEASVDAGCRKGKEDATQTTQRPWLPHYLLVANLTTSYNTLDRQQTDQVTWLGSRHLCTLTPMDQDGSEPPSRATGKLEGC
jgi:hypothetical protein